MAMKATTMLNVTSTAFGDGERIPVKYTGDGDDISPPLRWSGAQNVSEYAIICDDPDAPGGTFVHWVIYGIPGSFDHLDEGISNISGPGGEILQGKTSFGSTGYGGPAPPKGKPHHYIFKVYALDAKLDLPAGISKGELLKAIEGHVIAEGNLTGIYGR